MTVKDAREIVFAALEAKNQLDDSSASVLQTEIEKFLEVFRNNMGKNIDSARRTSLVNYDVEEAANLLRQTYGV